MRKQTIFLRIDGSRSVTADLNMRSKSITNLKDPQSDECTHIVNLRFVDKPISDKNAIIKTYFKKYVEDRIQMKCMMMLTCFNKFYWQTLLVIRDIRTAIT